MTRDEILSLPPNQHGNPAVPDYRNGYHNGWTDCQKSIAARLAAEEAQHAEPISEAWLREVGFVDSESAGQLTFALPYQPYQVSRWEVIVHKVAMIVELRSTVQIDGSRVCCWHPVVRETAKRSDVLRLLSALGIEVKGGSRADRS